MGSVGAAESFQMCPSAKEEEKEKGGRGGRERGQRACVLIGIDSDIGPR